MNKRQTQRPNVLYQLVAAHLYRDAMWLANRIKDEPVKGPLVDLEAVSFTHVVL